MIETSQLERLAAPLKWGFIADNVLLLIERASGPSFALSEKDYDILRGAKELLNLAETGVENMSMTAEVRGELTRIVESLTLYNYVASSSELERASFDRINDRIKEMIGAVDRWRAAGTLTDSDRDALRGFFRSISATTLQESNETLAHGSILSMPE